MLKFKNIRSLHQLVLQNSTDTKKLFKLVNEITGNKDQNPLSEAKSDKDLADEFAQFFNKIEKIREQFESLPTYGINNKDVPKLEKFATLSEKNLYKLIMEMPTKLCEIGIIPTKLLKRVPKHCIPTLTRIINLSPNRGKFHEGWKSTVVKLLIK